MKNSVCLAVILGLWMSAGVAGATDFKKSSPEKTSAPKAAAQAAPRDVSAKREEMRKKVEEKKKELNGSEWSVELNSAGKSEGQDVLTFQNGMFKSKMLSDKGFPATNYTITVPDGDQMAIWETMQTHPKGNVAFVRGEWKEGVMRGVISEQLEENKSRDYNFSSAAKKEVPATTEEKEEPKAEETAPAQALAATEEAPVAPFDPGTVEESAPIEQSFAKKK